MDPLTALSVASSIIQIVDFGGRLFALTTRTIRADGVIDGNADMELIVADLRVAAERLQKAAGSPSTRAIDQQTPDERLCALASRSHDLSMRLLNVLEEIKSKGSGRFRTWNAIRQSLHTMMKRDEIDEYLRRLEPLRSELVLNLVEVTRCVYNTTLRAWSSSSSS
jgi:hypothetical protein